MGRVPQLRLFQIKEKCMLSNLNLQLHSKLKTNIWILYSSKRGVEENQSFREEIIDELE